MKTSPISLVALAMPLAACVACPPDDCQGCNDPYCPTSTGYSYPSVDYSYPPVDYSYPSVDYSRPPFIPTGGQGTPGADGTRCPGSSDPDAAATPPTCGRDAGAEPPPASGADAGVAVPSPDAFATNSRPASDGGGLRADSTTLPPCTDAGTCGKPVVPLCTWSRECGTGGRCVDGECQRSCANSSTCGTGDTCQAGFCQAAVNSGGQCLYAADCSAGSECINAFCHGGCKVDGDCPNRADACTGNLCRPDGRSMPQCRSNQDCAPDRECVNATCRTACDSDQNCGAACSGTLCREGYCVQAQEIAPQCTRNATCGAGHTCIDAVCL
jgi:hypothetical protein